MDLEERSLDSAGGRCEQCGAKLTEDEVRLALEVGGPVLCKIHAAELAPLELEDPSEVDL